MDAVGIVAEYNPFHNGHKYMIEEIRRRCGTDTPVIAAMSGNWVQRGDCAAAEKHVRAKTALENGADLVLEIPLTWALASAERFARGGIGILKSTGIVKNIAFGSESGRLSNLSSYAAWIDSEEYRNELKKSLVSGINFAAARQNAIRARFPEFPDSADSPNDQLGIEYLRALSGSGISAIAITRIGVGHNGITSAEYASATELRRRMQMGEDISSFIPYDSGILNNIAFLSNCDRAILAVLRQKDASDFIQIPDCSEGLEHRIMKAIEISCSYGELCSNIKTKRYSYSRIRRIILRAYLGIDTEIFSDELPYIRILGANARGRELLHEMRSTASLPILTKPAAVRRMENRAFRQFELEARSTDLWQLCRETPGPCGTEWITDPVMTEL